MIECNQYDQLSENAQQSIHCRITDKLISLGLNHFETIPYRWTSEKNGTPLPCWMNVGQLDRWDEGKKYYLQQAIRVNMIYDDEPNITSAYAYFTDNLTWIGNGFAAYVPSDVIIKYKNKRVNIFNTLQEIGFKEGNILYISNDITFSNERMQIFFNTLHLKTITLDCQPRYTIADMKYLVQHREGLPCEQQRHFFKGMQMEDEKTLSDYNVQKESTIYIVLRLSGS